MKPRSQILLEKSISAMSAAIDIANKTKHPYKEESFVILASNAYELLFKAKWLKDNGNKSSALYIKQNATNKDGTKSKRKINKIGRSGNPITHEALHLIGKINEIENGKYKNVISNFEILLEARDSCIHFYTQDSSIERVIREVGLASVKNYIILLDQWFSTKAEELSSVLVPLGITNKTIDSVIGNREEEKFINFILNNSNFSEKDDYYVAMKLSVRFSKSDVPGAVPIVRTKDGIAVKIEITEDALLDQFKWEYKDLIDALASRYSDFKQDKKFNDTKKMLHGNHAYCHVRLLNPTNPKSGKKTFYSQSIINEFDKIYTRK